MSALALAKFADQGSLDWRRLVAIGVAADRLGVHQDHLSRICGSGLESNGLAHFGKHPDGGMPQWFISKDYDARLIDGPVGREWQEPDLSGFTDKQRDAACQKRACVEALRSATVNGMGPNGPIIERLVTALQTRYPALGLSRSSLYSWAKVYNRPADTIKLIDARGGNRMATASVEAWDYFKSIYLDDRRPSLSACWRATKRKSMECGWEWIGDDACRLHKRDYISAEQETFHRYPSVWRNTCEPFIPQDPESFRAGLCYVGDHKLIDCICSWRGTLIRPWLTTWMDWRTRRITGWVLSDSPNSTTILGALRHAIMDPFNIGGPERVAIDNGKDYDCWLFHGQTKSQRRSKIKPSVDEPRAHGIFGLLGIEAHFAIPWNPRSKGRLERWFGTLTEFARNFETYVGDSIDAKPELLQTILKKPSLIPSFEEVYARIGSHIAGYNDSPDHSKNDLSEGGLTISPNEAFVKWADTGRRAVDPKSLNLLLNVWHKPLFVGTNGITIHIRGEALDYGFCQSELNPFRGAKKSDRTPVRVAFDPHDLSTVRVYTMDYKYVCTSPRNLSGGQCGDAKVSVDTVKELSRQKARHKKALKDAAQGQVASLYSNHERLSEIANKKTPLVAQPTRLQIVHTPLDGAAREIERDELRGQFDGDPMSGPISRTPPAGGSLANIKYVPNDEWELPPDPLKAFRERINASS